jgi:hypothetical protein
LKVLICDVQKEGVYVGFDMKDVNGVMEAKLFRSPEKGLLGSVIYDGRLYAAVSLAKVIGGKKVRFFVVLKNGFAVGVSSVIEIEDLIEEVEVPPNLFEFFGKAFRFEDSLVYMIDAEKVSKIPPVEDVEVEEIYQDRNVEEPKEDIVIIGIGENFFAIRKSDITEIAEAENMNPFAYGSIQGFVQGREETVTVVSKWKIKPKWIVAMEGIAVACDYLDIGHGDVEVSEKGQFVIVEDKRYKILTRGEIEKWI